MPSRKEEKPPSPEALALLYLRSKRNWTQRELSTRLGLTEETRQISLYETGGRPLYRDRLEALAAALGYPPEAVDGLLLVDRWIDPVAPEEPFSPVALTPEEHRSRDRAVLTAAGVFLDELRQELSRKKRERKAAAVRRRAQELWLRLKAAPRQDRRDLVAAVPRFQDWALAEHVCEASIRAAAHKPDEALHLADLAVLIARKSPGAESWRSRLEGYCWAHVANARRVANDFAGADKAFAHAWKLWRAGTPSDPDLLQEWLLYAMEASLRREQHRFPEALELLEKARTFTRSDNSLILLQKEHIFEQLGDTLEALAALAEAAPFVEASRDIRLLFALRFKTANHLCHLGHYQKARELLPQVRELALRQGNELDLIRVVWLEARMDGPEQSEKAAAGLEQVRQDFTTRGLPYDAALASLDLAVLYLKGKRTAEVRDLARSMAWIFKAQGIKREALAALTLFREAAHHETATVELTLQVIAELERAKGSAPLSIHRQRGRG